MPRSPSNLYKEILFRGLDDKTKEEWKRLLNHSAMIDRMIEIVKEWIREAESTPMDDYDSPSWAYKQADRNGRVRSLKQVLSILDQKEKND